MSKFFGGVKKKFARLEQQAMAKMGRAEQTVDTEFDQQSTVFKEQYNKTKKLSKFVKQYEIAIKEFSTSQTGFTQMILDQYEPHCPLYKAATLYEKLTASIEEQRHEIEKSYEEGFHTPLADYLGQYKTLEDRILDRNNRLIDMDLAKNEYKSLMERGQTEPTRLQLAKEKADLNTKKYEALNRELMSDIPKLCQDRLTFFDSLFANLVDGQLRYFRAVVQILAQMEPALQTVNRVAHTTHRWVITDATLSAYQKGSSVAPDGSPQQRPPSQQQPQVQYKPQQPTQQQPPQQQYQQPPPQQQQYQQPPPQQQYQQPPPQQQYQPPPQQYQQPPPQQQYQQPPPPQQYQQPPPQQGGVVRAKALYPFQGEDSTELTFNFGDVIVITKQGGEWWEGELNGRRGLFPANYVQQI